jgi:hypothetical protein
MKVLVIGSRGDIKALAEWQAEYGLEPGSDQVGKYFSLRDPKLAQDLEEYGQLVVNELLIKVLDSFREKVKSPVIINSFNRNDAKQAQLHRDGLKAAKYSPHVVKMAADIDTKTPEQTRQWAKTLREVANQLGIKIRIGTEQYLSANQTFIHVDVCPEYYAKGKPFYTHFHPKEWESPINW